MDLAPEELPTPASLGGSILDGVTVAPEDEAGDVSIETPEDTEVDEESGQTIVSLAERAADEKEDMVERNEWQRQIDEQEAADEDEPETITEEVESAEVEEQE